MPKRRSAPGSRSAMHSQACAPCARDLFRHVDVLGTACCLETIFKHACGIVLVSFQVISAAWLECSGGVSRMAMTNCFAPPSRNIAATIIHLCYTHLIQVIESPLTTQMFAPLHTSSLRFPNLRPATSLGNPVAISPILCRDNSSVIRDTTSHVCYKSGCRKPSRRETVPASRARSAVEEKGALS